MGRVRLRSRTFWTAHSAVATAKMQATRLPLQRSDQRDQRLDSKVFQEGATLQVRRVKRVALAEIAGLVAAAKPAGALFGTAVRK